MENNIGLFCAKIISGILLFVSIILSCFFIWFLSFAVMFLLWLIILYVWPNEKVYKYGQHKIVVYSSFFFHRLFVDDKLCDENNTFIYYVDIVLDDNIETIAGDKTSRVKIVATINLFNRIKLKIDGKLQIPEIYYF